MFWSGAAAVPFTLAPLVHLAPLAIALAVVFASVLAVAQKRPR
jgi:hypothetical protein